MAPEAPSGFSSIVSFSARPSLEPNHGVQTLPFVAAWMDLENIVLSEITQSEKTNAI